MNSTWLALAIILQAASAPKTFMAQFVREVSGRPVTVCLDGRKVERTFAGKLGFTDGKRGWTSVCAAVRRPIVTGQAVGMRVFSSAKVGGNYAKAGNIVANCFDAAQSPDQCAALQIAVWEAIEDGGRAPNFSGGRFQVQADYGVLAQATQYYAMVVKEKDAVLLEAAKGRAQSQLSTDGKDHIPPGPPTPDGK